MKIFGVILKRVILKTFCMVGSLVFTKGIVLFKNCKDLHNWLVITDLLQKINVQRNRFWNLSQYSFCRTRLCKGSNWTVWSLNSCNSSHTALFLMLIQLKNESILKLTVATGSSFNRMIPFVSTVWLLSREVGVSVWNQWIHCTAEAEKKTAGVTVGVSPHKKTLPRKINYTGSGCDFQYHSPTGLFKLVHLQPHYDFGHYYSALHQFWFPYLNKLSAYINLCIDIFMWFPSGKGLCSHTIHINPYYNSCLTLLADFNQSPKSSRDLRHNYFPTVFIKTDKPSTGKTSCYCWHEGQPAVKPLLHSEEDHYGLHRRGPLWMLLNEGNEPFITHTLLDIRDSNHKTCRKSKLDLLSPAAHGSVSQYVPMLVSTLSVWQHPKQGCCLFLLCIALQNFPGAFACNKISEVKFTSHLKVHVVSRVGVQLWEPANR